MHQTPAAILVLASAILGHTASARGADSVGVVIGLGGLALGSWGVVSLIRHGLRRQRLSAGTPVESSGLNWTGADSVAGLGGGGTRVVARASSPVRAAGHAPDSELSPEISAQLSLVAHLQRQDRTQIMEELLRRHLPRYTNSSTKYEERRTNHSCGTG